MSVRCGYLVTCLIAIQQIKSARCIRLHCADDDSAEHVVASRTSSMEEVVVKHAKEADPFARLANC